MTNVLNVFELDKNGSDISIPKENVDTMSEDIKERMRWDSSDICDMAILSCLMPSISNQTIISQICPDVKE